jgi:hypothetical protein
MKIPRICRLRQFLKIGKHEGGPLIYFDYIYSCMYVDFILSSNKHYSFYLEIIYKLCWPNTIGLRHYLFWLPRMDSNNNVTKNKWDVELVGVTGPYEWGVQSVHRSGTLRAMKGPMNLWRPHRLNHRRFILIFFIFLGVFSTIFSLFLYVIWTFCCTGNKSFMKVYQWFYWTSNSEFCEKSQPIPGLPM